MTDAYRDDGESLRAKNAELEQEVARLREKVKRHDAGRAMLVAGVVLACAGIGGALFAPRLARSSPPPPESPSSPAAPPVPVVAHADAPDCAHPGVHLTLGGEDAFAPAAGTRDLAGNKYRRDGSRSPWFTVQGGALYVHGVGDFLSGDVGKTRLVLLDVVTKGESGGYTLARDGKSLVEVTASDGKTIQGRFEADVSKVEDTTRPPPFGTPVVRLRGTFCLPALPANPSDTGP